MQILLLQFRDDPKIKQTEYDSFLHYTGLDANALISLDALEEDFIVPILDHYDALIVGGNGSESVTMADQVPFAQPVIDTLKEARRLQLPTFNVCFGAQFATLAFGGLVEKDPARKETGTCSITFTEAAKHDALFKPLTAKASTCAVQQGHNDSMTVLPEGAELLAGSEVCPIQAWHFPGEAFYSVQFHPELGKEELYLRYMYYKDYYANSPEEFQAILDSIEDSEEASELLKRFIDVFVRPATQA